MKKSKLYIIAALAASGVLAFASCAPSAAENDTAVQPEGNMEEQSPEDMTNSEDDMDAKEFTGDAYNFNLTDTQGNAYMLSDLQGKKVYIKFWASWCSICLAGIEELKELDAAFRDSEDVLILTMVAPGASGEMSEEKFKEWFALQGYEFTALVDTGGAVMREYGIRGFPTSVFIDTSGNVEATRIGHVDNAAIEDTLSGMS